MMLTIFSVIDAAAEAGYEIPVLLVAPCTAAELRLIPYSLMETNSKKRKEIEEISRITKIFVKRR